MKKTQVKKISADAEVRDSEKTALNLYLKEIDRIPLLTKGEEEKYAKDAAKGNAAARQKLVNANLRFVISVAKKYQGKGLLLEDLISEGNIGLMNAISHFDADKGYRFITYAVWWIRQSIIRAINEKGRMIRLPGNKANELIQIDKTRRLIQNEPGWSAATEAREIASYLEITQEKAEELLKIGQDAVSLDDPAQKGENTMSVKDYIIDERAKDPCDFTINSVLKDELTEAVNSLETRAAEVIRCRFGLGDAIPLTLTEIGNRYDLSRERVRQIEKLALIQLQKSSRRTGLENYIA